MKLQLVSEGKCFAFLAEDSGLHLDMHLNEVRARLNTEAEELMPSSYKFLFRNIPLSANQVSFDATSLLGRIKSRNGVICA